jgi:hypothetical protein
VIHSVWVVLAPVTLSMQVTEYQPPGVGPPGANPPSSLRSSDVEVHVHGLAAPDPPPRPDWVPGAPFVDPPSETPTVTVPSPLSEPVAAPKAGGAVTAMATTIVRIKAKAGARIEATVVVGSVPPRR